MSDYGTVDNYPCQPIADTGHFQIPEEFKMQSVAPGTSPEMTLRQQSQKVEESKMEHVTLSTSPRQRLDNYGYAVEDWNRESARQLRIRNEELRRLDEQERTGEPNRESSLLDPNPGDKSTLRSAFSDDEKFRGERTARNTKLTGEHEHHSTPTPRPSLLGKKLPEDYSQIGKCSSTPNNFLNVGDGTLSANEPNEGSNSSFAGVRTATLQDQIDHADAANLFAESETSSENSHVRSQIWDTGREVVEDIAEDPIPFMGFTPGQGLFLSVVAAIVMSVAVAIWRPRHLFGGNGGSPNAPKGDPRTYVYRKNYFTRISYSTLGYRALINLWNLVGNFFRNLFRDYSRDLILGTRIAFWFWYRRKR